MARCALALVVLAAACACGRAGTTETAGGATTQKKASVASAAFGQVDNAPVTIYTLTNVNGMEVRTIPYGAIIV